MILADPSDGITEIEQEIRADMTSLRVKRFTKQDSD